jgi:hypothetical protein
MVVAFCLSTPTSGSQWFYEKLRLAAFDCATGEFQWIADSPEVQSARIRLWGDALAFFHGPRMQGESLEDAHWFRTSDGKARNPPDSAAVQTEPDARSVVRRVFDLGDGKRIHQHGVRVLGAPGEKGWTIPDALSMDARTTCGVDGVVFIARNSDEPDAPPIEVLAFTPGQEEPLWTRDLTPLIRDFGGARRPQLHLHGRRLFFHCRGHVFELGLSDGAVLRSWDVVRDLQMDLAKRPLLVEAELNPGSRFLWWDRPGASFANAKDTLIVGFQFRVVALDLKTGSYLWHVDADGVSLAFPSWPTAVAVTRSYSKDSTTPQIAPSWGRADGVSSAMPPTTW